MSEEKNNFPDFTGKCISMTIIDDSTSHDLENPHFEYQGNRLFIVGNVPVGSTQSDWVANCQSAVAWNRVTDYFVLENFEAYTKAIKISEKFNKKNTNDKS